MPTWLLYTIGVLVFAFGLLFSIALHEVGHMVPAKRFGVKVTQYMVGFGPTVWSRRRGDTEYGVKAIPLGGYIRMIGMIPPRRDGRPSRWPTRMATAIEEFRQVSRQEIDPADDARQFYRLTPGKKMIIMVGGPCMNLLIYVVLTLVIVLGVGVPKSEATTTVDTVTQCVVAATSPEANSTTCPADAVRAPAYRVLEPGDRILSVDGTAVTSWDQLVSIIQPSAGKALHLVVERGGVKVPVTVTPVDNIKYVNGTSGKTVDAGFLGITSHIHDYYATLPLSQVPGQIGSQIKLGIDTLAQYPHKIHSLWETVFDGAKRDPNGAVGVVGIGRISGDFAASKDYTVHDKVITLLSLLASINLLLFFFNLLPILPLDGGHVAGAVVEAVKRGWARLRARGRPVLVGADGVAVDQAGRPVRDHRQIFVDTAQMLPVMYAVASVLVLMTLLTLYADIVKPISIPGG